jgi:hypothetical protein
MERKGKERNPVVQIIKIPVAQLVFDFNLYPRSDVDETHVAHIAEAIRAGTEMPPAIADADDYRVIDGFHRGRAIVRVFGPKAEIAVILKQYRSDRERFIDAMKYNAHHGHNLTTVDRARCILFAEKLRISVDVLADALSMTTEAVGKLTVNRVGKLRVANAADTAEKVPLKYVVRHMKGRTMTRAQVEAQKRLGGNNQVFIANQLITLIENDLLDSENGKLMERLAVLRTHLNKMALKS